MVLPAVAGATEPAPVAAYSFDEEVGSVAHDSAGNHDATIEGAEWETGKYGSGLAFDASSHDLLIVPQSEDLQLEDFTLEAWVKPTESQIFAPVISRWNEEDYGYALYAGGEIAGHPEGVVTNQHFVDSYAYSPSALAINSWTHIAVTSDGEDIKLYVNGSLVDTRESSEVKAGEGPLEIGGSDFFEENEYFDGIIDEVRIYSRALTVGEIQEDKETGIGLPMPTTLPETISTDTTLTAKGGPYIGESTSITSGTTLTIKPGTVIKLGEDMIVQGTINAEGTTKRPIYFTSRKDDSIGGDTNGDESETEPQPGDWKGLEFNGGTGSSALVHTVVRYGGHSQAMVVVNCPCSHEPSFIDSTFTHSARSGIELEDSSATILGSTITENAEKGIRILGEGAPEVRGNTISDNERGIVFDVFSEDHASVNITENLIEGNAEDGIDISAGTAFTHIDAASLGGNTLKENGAKAISYEAFSGGGEMTGNPIPADITTNMLSGNGENGIWIGGQVTEDQTWEDPGYSMVLFSNGVDIAEGATLTLGQGMTLKSAGANVYVEGTLKSQGTAEHPVTFTSAKDDTVDGDTNGDGASSEPEPADWIGLKFPTGTGSPDSSVLEHTIVMYGGRKSFPFNAMVEVHCPCANDPEFINSTFAHSRRTAIELSESSATILGSTITENAEKGIRILGEGAPEVRGNTISDNERGIVFDVFSEDHASVNITENLIEGNAEDGIDISAGTAFTHIDAASLGGNTLKENGAKAISYEAFSGGGEMTGNPIPADITTNMLSGNGENGIWIGGQVTEDQTWEDPGYSMVLFSNGVDIAEGATLTLEAGLTVKAEGAALYLDGEIEPEGGPEHPVAFTSIKDDTLAGDTNGDGGATQPKPGDWSGILIAEAKELALSYLDLRYAKTALNLEYLDSMLIQNSDFVFNLAASEAEETAVSDPGLAELPCVPPYLSFVIAHDDWFGENGKPAPSVSIGGLINGIVPEKYAPLFSSMFSTAKEVVSFYGKDNTIPFTSYSCPAIGIPDIPVTPVLVDGTPAEPWFPDPEVE